MPVYVRRYLGRAAIRDSDKRLVPAIIACNFAVCFLMFGIFLTISGVIFRSVAKSSSESIGNSGPAQSAVTAGTVILSIGSILCGVGVALLIFAFINVKRYETIRRNELHSNPSGLPNMNNYETSFTTNAPQTVHYPMPAQPNPYQHQSNVYQPQHQSNVYQPQHQSNVYQPQHQSNVYQPQHQSNFYQPQQLYTIPDESEAPPSYSVEPIQPNDTSRYHPNQQQFNSQKF